MTHRRESHLKEMATLYSTPSLIVRGCFLRFSSSVAFKLSSEMVTLPFGAPCDSRESECRDSWGGGSQRAGQRCPSLPRLPSPLTLGLLGSPGAAWPGAMPRLAFHRARLSSSASSCAYSATDFFSPSLYPSVSVSRPCQLPPTSLCLDLRSRSLHSRVGLSSSSGTLSDMIVYFAREQSVRLHDRSRL